MTTRTVLTAARTRVRAALENVSGTHFSVSTTDGTAVVRKADLWALVYGTASIDQRAAAQEFLHRGVRPDTGETLCGLPVEDLDTLLALRPTPHETGLHSANRPRPGYGISTGDIVYVRILGGPSPYTGRAEVIDANQRDGYGRPALRVRGEDGTERQALHAIRVDPPLCP